MACVQVASLILSLSSIVLLLYRMRTNYRIRLYHFGTLVWLIHAALFYVVVALRNAGKLEVSFLFNDWSSLLRLHILLTTALQVVYGAVCDVGADDRIRQWVRFFNEH